MKVLIHFERTVDDDRIALVGLYATQDEAHQVMQTLYDTKLAESDEWEYDLCGISGIDAVVQDEYHYCHRWFIFESADAGIHYIFS